LVCNPKYGPVPTKYGPVPTKYGPCANKVWPLCQQSMAHRPQSMAPVPHTWLSPRAAATSHGWVTPAATNGWVTPATPLSWLCASTKRPVRPGTPACLLLFAPQGVLGVYNFVSQRVCLVAICWVTRLGYTSSTTAGLPRQPLGWLTPATHSVPASAPIRAHSSIVPSRLGPQRHPRMAPAP
jgi:hypothetical protein